VGRAKRRPYRVDVGAARAAKGKQVRGRRVVEKVLDAALEELAGGGYENLSFERIAERAGVNKVTIYRRWPTKRRLVREALHTVAESAPLRIDTGTLRGDLLAHLKSTRDILNTCKTKALFRTLTDADGELFEMATALRAEKNALALELLGRGVTRGELPAHVDQEALLSILTGTLINRAFIMRERCSNAELETIVDIVLAGAQHVRPRARRRGSRRGSARSPRHEGSARERKARTG
jgi:AcrR family transcriptional regulator